MTRLRRTTPCAGVALVLALVAACGGGDSDAAGSGAETGTVVDSGDLQEIFAYYLEALPAAGWDGN